MLSRVSRFQAFVYRYFPNVKGLLAMNKPGEINASRNIITDDSSLRTAFASFQLALEPLGGHTYDIGTSDGFHNRWLPKDRQVYFQTTTDIGLPDPELLRTHHAIAGFLHASGIGEEIDRILEGDMEAEETYDTSGIDLKRVNHLLTAIK